MKLQIVVGISGASGAAIGVRVLERLAQLDAVETHLVVSAAAEQTLRHEVGPDGLSQASRLAHTHHPSSGIGASIASGSFPSAGMIVAPCSMRTLSAIASGISDNLLVRAADVHLKERRPLVLLARESPLHLGYLRSMVQVTEMGAVVAPPVPAFYQMPKSVADIVDAIAARAIDMLGLTLPRQARAWMGLEAAV